MSLLDIVSANAVIPQAFANFFKYLNRKRKMSPVITESSNGILTPPEGTEDRVFDLPVTLKDSTVESCWQMTWRDRLTVLRTGRVWFSCWGATHPPIKLEVRREK